MKDNSVKIVDNNYDHKDVLTPIAADIGKESIMGCVKTQGHWIITLKNKEDVQLLQETGVKIKDDHCSVSGVTKTLLTVSFFGVPMYIDDYELTQKLEEFGCIIKSKWIRKYYVEFPKIENGIRFVRLELPTQAKSLPYAVTINNVHMRIKHNGQLRVCNLCLSEEHIKRECPYYRCRECDEQGHTFSRCPNIKCYKCGKPGHKSFQCKEGENAMEIPEQPESTPAPAAEPNNIGKPMEAEVNTGGPSDPDPGERATQFIWATDRSKQQPVG